VTKVVPGNDLCFLGTTFRKFFLETPHRQFLFTLPKLPRVISVLLFCAFLLWGCGDQIYNYYTSDPDTPYGTMDADGDGLSDGEEALH
jgi:hypothetical protein